MQKARIAATNKLAALGDGGASAANATCCVTCCAFAAVAITIALAASASFASGIPSRRRIGGWMMDLSNQRDGHKT